MTLAPLTSLGLVSSHTNLLATGQRRYAIKRSNYFAKRSSCEVEGSLASHSQQWPVLTAHPRTFDFDSARVGTDAFVRPPLTSTLTSTGKGAASSRAEDSP